MADPAQQGATNCNAKNSSPSITTVSTSAATTTAPTAMTVASVTTSRASAASAVDALAATAASSEGSIDAEADDPSELLESESTSASTARTRLRRPASYSSQYTSSAANETTDQFSSTSGEVIESTSAAASAVSASVAATTASSSASTTTTAACTPSGTCSEGTDVSSCSSIVISDLTVPKGVTLDLTDIADGATITFEGTLDSQGSWYWEQGTSISKPVFSRLKKGHVVHTREFQHQELTAPHVDCEDTTLTELTLDSSAGDDTAKNTDGFDLSRNVGLTISDCTVYNQDDCLAMQSSNDTTFSGNTCSGGHGGSLEGDSVTETIIDLYGSITGATYTDNTLSNVENAIVFYSDYSKSEGVYTGGATSKVEITDITISGRSGTADAIYDILVNADVVGHHSDR
ncbi:Parallel beta-helix repeat-2 [Phytophthora cactorum]|nr:Parallel beta-helix repeat-2 [Phytophthora cactorum]